jgi:hypothetical protein
MYLYKRCHGDAVKEMLGLTGYIMFPTLDYFVIFDWKFSSYREKFASKYFTSECI